MFNFLDIERLNKALALKKFSEFIKQAWHVVEPAYELKWNWHIEAIADHLQAVHEGKISRLIINIPFRCSKSTICSILFPAWVWANTPSRKIISTSYDEALALRDSWAMRSLINSEWFKDLTDFSIEIRDDQCSKRFFANNHGGHRLARGILSGATGHTAELLIADDPMNGKKVFSDQERQSVIDSFNNQFMTRLSPPGKGAVVIVMQRLHHQDLSGVFLENPKWDRLIIPMEWDGQNRSRTQLNWVDPRKEIGELMFPEYFTREAVDEYKSGRTDMGMSAAQFVASQLQQNPVATEGSIIKNEWIRFYDELPHVKRWTWSWDTAFKTGQLNDYSVGTLWAECEDGFYLVDLVRKKIEYTALKGLIKSCYDAQPASEVIVEDKATGQSLVQDLRRFTNLPVIPVIPGRDMPGSKEERLNFIAGRFESGKVKIPSNATWKLIFIQELTEFGYQPHDDIVDSTTQYLVRTLKTSASSHFRVLKF